MTKSAGQKAATAKNAVKAAANVSSGAEKQSAKKIVVIKIGGKAASERSAMKQLFLELKKESEKYNFVFVHGGGAEVTRISKIFGLEAVFKNGIRITTEKEMEVVDMVLSGRMNKEIVRLANCCGLKTAGLSGSDALLFTGKRIAENTLTGKITNVNSDIIKLFFKEGYLPVVCSTSMEKKGTALNINADEAALEIAISLKADKIFFISDIPGVIKDKNVINILTKKDADNEIKSGVISGGMIPKVKSSVAALKKGVKTIIIGEYLKKDDLLLSLNAKKGTSIIL